MSEVKKEKITSVKGMNDVLPDQAHLWLFFEEVVKSLVQAYGYQAIRTPILEHTPLFERSIGEVTDIVEKEMYSFVDRLNNDSLTMRPEGTAGVVRSVIEHNLVYDSPKRLWYIGPMFRHERPQRGRYRQFHQFGLEAIGFAGPDIDAEIILMCQRLWDDLGLHNIQLQLNTLGQLDERKTHRAALITYFEKYKADLDEDASRRLYSNPLRILDTKNPKLQEMVNAAPQLTDYLGKESLAHFEQLQTILKANNLPFKLNPRLVRGMDYYNLTVFEWVTDRLGAQGTLGGGGRYDPLIQMIGGKPTPACGMAMGIERILELLKEDRLIPEADAVDIYVISQGQAARTQASVIAEMLRNMGLNTILHCNHDGKDASFKSQMKKADQSGAKFAVIIGENELQKQSANVKMLRLENTEQKEISFEHLGEYLIDQMTALF